MEVLLIKMQFLYRTKELLLCEWTEEEINKRVTDTFEELFYGEDRFFHFFENDDTIGYMEDTGNHDARTEGMSYGMMIAVQFDRKDIFDKI